MYLYSHLGCTKNDGFLEFLCNRIKLAAENPLLIHKAIFAAMFLNLKS